MALDHTTRGGEPTRIWHRGALVPRPVTRTEPDEHGVLALLHTSDQARRVGPDGRENLSLAAAFEIGRLLALAEPSVVAALLTWRKDGYDSARRGDLLGRDPALRRILQANVGRGFAALAGNTLIASLGTDGAVRLGPPRPAIDPGRPIEAIDDVDPVLACRRASPCARSCSASSPKPGIVRELGGVELPEVREVTDLETLAKVASRELAGLRTAAADAAAELAAATLRRAARANAMSRATPRRRRARRPAVVAAPKEGARRRDEPRASTYLSTQLLFEATASAVQNHAEEVAETEDGGILPTAVRTFLARLRLLEGVPFAHLVPDSELLPLESIRFFYLDREWTDALVQGALSVGTVTTLDREHLQALHAAIRDEVDTEERHVRMVGGEDVGRGEAGAISGFLLRSRAVSGWPALHVRAYREESSRRRHDRRGRPAAHAAAAARAARSGRAACLFDGIPRVVHVEEPRQGIQFGVDLAVGGAGTAGATIPLRDVNENAARVRDPTRRFPFRRGAPGVIDVAKLAERIAAQPATNTGEFEGAGDAERRVRDGDAPVPVPRRSSAIRPRGPEAPADQPRRLRDPVRAGDRDRRPARLDGGHAVSPDGIDPGQIREAMFDRALGGARPCGPLAGGGRHLDAAASARHAAAGSGRRPGAGRARRRQRRRGPDQDRDPASRTRRPTRPGAATPTGAVRGAVRPRARRPPARWRCPTA